MEETTLFFIIFISIMTQTNQVDDTAEELKDQTHEEVDETVENEEEQSSDSNPNNEEQVDYKEKFSNSAKEAIKQTKEVERLKKESSYKDKLILVAQNQEKLHEIAQEDPEMADRITKHYWGKTYSEATKTEEEAKPDAKAIAKQVYHEEKQSEEKVKIEDYEIDYFIENKIEIGSPRYKKIMSTYGKMTPSTLSDAKEFMSMAHKHNFPTEEIVVTAPNTSFGSSGHVKKSEFTADDQEIMKRKGWSAETMREYKSSALYS